MLKPDRHSFEVEARRSPIGGLSRTRLSFKESDLHLVQHIDDAVDRYWTVDVEIIGIWADGPAACVVHRRTIDPTTFLGHRFEFTPTSADGTIEGYARDIAITLAEPIGTLAATTRQDEHGIVWVVIPAGRPTPEPPAGVLEKLGLK